MPRTLPLLLALLCGCGASPGRWKQLPPLPDPQGFAGSFAGVSNGTLLLAGGANFPERKPWEGGAKVWYDTIFALERPDGQWIAAGRLPRPLGYGVCVSHNNAVICVGGSDANQHYPDAFRLEWKDHRIVTTTLPSLPRPVANACGALVGDILYVAGGQQQPDSKQTLRTVYRINLAAPQPAWQEVDPWPGSGRMLAIAASLSGSFFIAGGADLVVTESGRLERRYLNDAYRYDPAGGWQRIADLPHPVVAAPSPAPTGPSSFCILGGDDGSQVTVAATEHRGFSRRILRFDARSGRWSVLGALPAPRVTTSCVYWAGSWVIPSGELRPGVRSPQVWALTQPKPE
jgi:N-acetylneuraminic acid mutarotase